MARRRDPKEVTMLPLDLFVNLVNTTLQEQILNSNKMEVEAADTLKLLLEEGPTDLQNDLQDWTVETKDDKHMLFQKGKAYIPNNIELRCKIIQSHHNAATIQHC